MSKASTIRAMSDEQLLHEIRTARKSLFDLRVHGSTERNNQASVAKRQRKEIARLLTIQRERRNITPASEFVRGNESTAETHVRNLKLNSIKADCVAKANSLGLNFGQHKEKPWNCTLEINIWGHNTYSIHEAEFCILRFPNQNAATITCNPIANKSSAITDELANELKRSGIANDVWI